MWVSPAGQRQGFYLTLIIRTLVLQSASAAHNVQVRGCADGPPLLFAHGFGCDQNMWRLVAPAFERDYRVVTFDYVGAGGATRSFDPHHYASLEGYANDVVSIIEQLDLRDVIFVGHSVSAMIGVLAARQLPDRFARMVMIAPSPHYLNDGNYPGGFSREDIDELLLSVEQNFRNWSAAFTPLIMANPERPELAKELEESFCRMDPGVALHFARITFLSDNRADLPHHLIPTLVLQCAEDFIASSDIGRYTADQLRHGTIHYLTATGHCPHLSAPEETVAAINRFLHAPVHE